MRFKSGKKDGFQIFAVSGINTISFAIQATDAARKGLLGFAVERFDRKAGERYFMPGFKVFQSIIPHPDKSPHVSTFNHPVQSFVWDDFTAKENHEYEYYFHPVRGKPKNLDRGEEREQGVQPPHGRDARIAEILRVSRCGRTFGTPLGTSQNNRTFDCLTVLVERSRPSSISGNAIDLLSRSFVIKSELHNTIPALQPRQKKF